MARIKARPAAAGAEGAVPDVVVSDVVGPDVIGPDVAGPENAGTQIEAPAAAAPEPASAEAAGVEPADTVLEPPVDKPVLASVLAAVAAPSSAAQDRTAPSEEKDVSMDTTTTGTTQAPFSVFTDRANGAVEKSTRMFEELNAFGKGNVEALVESSKIAAKAMETVGQDVADYAKTSFESSAAAMKTLAAASSPTEFFKLQSDYARAAFDTMIAQGSRSTEKMLKMAGEIAQPISNRVAVATDRIKTSA
jgi:phasin family protein